MIGLALLGGLMAPDTPAKNREKKKDPVAETGKKKQKAITEAELIVGFLDLLK